MNDAPSAPPPPAELGPFLRARRERTAPGDVGLPGAGRRRTPGLRREEVATLAGVSVDYLVRLEQGRDVNPSPEVLGALADAMRMSDDERRHLFHVASQAGHEALCPPPVEMRVDVAPTVRALLQALQPTRAFVIDAVGDVLAWNPAWAALSQGVGLLDDDPVDGDRLPNLVRFVFTDPAARAVFPGWRAVADEQTSRLRLAHTRWPREPRVAALVEELSSDAEFRARWRAHPIDAPHRGTLRLGHPTVGELVVTFEALDLVDDAGQQLVSWLPADEVTAARLVEVSAPRRLRLVEGA